MRWSPRTSTRRHSTRTAPGFRVAQSGRFGEVLPRPDGLGPEEGTADSGGYRRAADVGQRDGPVGQRTGGPADRLPPHRSLCLCFVLCVLCWCVPACVCVCAVRVSVSVLVCVYRLGHSKNQKYGCIHITCMQNLGDAGSTRAARQTE